MEKIMRYVYLTLNWSFGLLFALTGLLMLVESLYAGLCLVVVSFFLLPPVRKAIYSKTNKELPIKIRTISIFVLILSSFIFLGVSGQKEAEEMAAQKAQEQAEQVAKKRQESIDYFNSNREEILSSISASFSEKDYQSVIAQSGKYLIANDTELTSIHNEAKSVLGEIRKAEREAAEKVERAEKTAEILATLKLIPTSEFKDNKDLYQQLVKLNPENSSYKDKFKHYSQKLQAKQAEERAKREKLKKEQELRIAMFGEKPTQSAWDGSYYAVKTHLKRVANDPDSIEIDACTKVYRIKEGWLVGCDYRGRNGFGGMVRQSNWFTIVHDRVIETHDASAYSP